MNVQARRVAYKVQFKGWNVAEQLEKLRWAAKVDAAYRPLIEALQRGIRESKERSNER